MINARSGNGSPASVVSGSASAAASVTAPRSPIHETTAGRCQGGAGSRLSDNPQRNQGTYDNGKIQMIRITITAKPTRAAVPSTGGLSILRRTAAIRKPITSPTAIPPAAVQTNRQPASQIEKLPERTATTATR